MGIDATPTSWDCVTIVTSFCLMSPLTAPLKEYKVGQGQTICDFRGEHPFDYHQDAFMTSNMTVHLDGVVTRIVVDSNIEPEIPAEYTKQALDTCFAGEGIQNAIEMETSNYLIEEAVEEDAAVRPLFLPLTGRRQGARSTCALPIRRGSGLVVVRRSCAINFPAGGGAWGQDVLKDRRKTGLATPLRCQAGGSKVRSGANAHLVSRGDDTFSDEPESTVPAVATTRCG